MYETKKRKADSSDTSSDKYSKGSGSDDEKESGESKKVVRPQRKRRVRLADDERYFVDPVWNGDWTKYGGGTGVTATLTYRAVEPANYGSGPVDGECGSVSDLNEERHNGTNWVAGHLLNDNMGGPGTSKNLTPMTGWRNRTFNGDFEEKIKTALIKSRQLDDSGRCDVWYGIKVTVVCTGLAAGGTKAAKCVRQRVAYGAKWVSVTKEAKAADRTITLLTRAKPHDSLPDLPQNGHFNPGETNPNG